MPGRQHCGGLPLEQFSYGFSVLEAFIAITKDDSPDAMHFTLANIYCRRLVLHQTKKELPGPVLEVCLPGSLASVAANQDEKPTTLIISKNKFFYKYLHLI